MAKKFPIAPSHPERICWGCDRYCPAGALACGNGAGRTEHPIETLGERWYEDFGIDPETGLERDATAGPPDAALATPDVP
jgi:hypothetical protein